MERLNQLCSTFTRGQKPALMTHVVLGYPSLKESIRLVRVMADSGAKLIELQIPFTDPIADGPTIMYASQHALGEGVRTKDCMKAMEELATKVDAPLLFMSYYNLLLNYAGGLERFFKDARSAGAEGLIVPDIPPEEKADGYWTQAPKAGLAAIPLVSPVSSTERLKKISQAAKHGFVYCVSTTGTTGARKNLPVDLPQYLARVRKHFKQPLAVGFGISKPEQVRALKGHAEIAIVGSAVIDVVKNARGSFPTAKISGFVSKLAN